jgi:hypothetical protein
MKLDIGQLRLTISSGSSGSRVALPEPSRRSMFCFMSFIVAESRGIWITNRFEKIYSVLSWAMVDSSLHIAQKKRLSPRMDHL